MVTEHVNGEVRDKAHAEDILAALRLVLPPGARVRITSKLVRVDFAGVVRYTANVAEPVKVGGQELP